MMPRSGCETIIPGRGVFPVMPRPRAAELPCKAAASGRGGRARPAPHGRPSPSRIVLSPATHRQPSRGRPAPRCGRSPTEPRRRPQVSNASGDLRSGPGRGRETRAERPQRAGNRPEAVRHPVVAGLRPSHAADRSSPTPLETCGRAQGGVGRPAPNGHNPQATVPGPPSTPLWPVSDRATPPTAGLQRLRRPAVGLRAGSGDPRPTAITHRQPSRGRPPGARQYLPHISARLAMDGRG